MNPQIQMRSDHPAMSYTTDAVLVDLRRVANDGSVEFSVGHFSSAYSPRLPVTAALETQVATITIQDIDADGQVVLRRKSPLVLVVERRGTEGVYWAEFPDLDVPIAGYSPDELISEAHALIDSTWRGVMHVEDAMLAPRAILLRERLRALYDEVD